MDIKEKPLTGLEYTTYVRQKIASTQTGEHLTSEEMAVWTTYLQRQELENSEDAKNAQTLATKPIKLTKYRNERNLMLYPFCSTSRSKRLKTINYRSSDGKRWLQVTANHEYGMAKIWDFDILRFALSKAGEIRRTTGYFPSSVSFSPYECLKTLGRDPKAGKNYKWMEQALERLMSTTYKGNIFRDDSDLVEGFTLINYHYKNEGDRIKLICINFDDRLIESTRYQKGLLAIDQAVINEESGIKKRLLELVKVSTGQNLGWKVGLKRLQEMCAHEGDIREFKRQLSHYELPWKIEFTEATNGGVNVNFTNKTTVLENTTK